MNWISIIPMRAGSKGVKNKNIRLICGKPLYRYTVDFAFEAGTKKVYITTDIPEIIALPNEKNIVIAQRKNSLCHDDSQMSLVILDFLTSGVGKIINDEQTIVLLQATSPLRKKSDLLEALEIFSKSPTTNLMMAVTETKNDALKYGYVINGKFNHISEPSLCFENRQNLPKLYKPTGGFYIFKAGWYRSNKSFATRETSAHQISNNQSLDIDTIKDLKRFEAILGNGEVVN